MIKRIRILLLFALCFLTPIISARPLVQNWGSWQGILYDNPVTAGSKWNYLFIAQLRLIARPDVYHQAFFNAGVSYNATKNWSLGGGYRFFTYARPLGNDVNVNRAYQAGIWTTSFLQVQRILLHSQFEERFRIGQYKMAMRFRERVAWDYTISRKLTLSLSDEVFIGLIKPAWVAQSTFDQNRLFFGFSSLLGHNKTRIMYGYLNQYLDRRPKNIMNHLLLVMFLF